MSDRNDSHRRKGSILNFRTGKVQDIKEKHIVSIKNEMSCMILTLFSF